MRERERKVHEDKHSSLSDEGVLCGRVKELICGVKKECIWLSVKEKWVFFKEIYVWLKKILLMVGLKKWFMGMILLKHALHFFLATI